MTMELAQQAETTEERAEVARDLRAAARQALGVEEENQEWEIRDVSPLRKLYILYSMVDGMRYEVPKFVFEAMITRQVRTRKGWIFAFTAFKDRAPAYKTGKVLCFLHEESPDRPILDELGIQASCDANELRNLQSKRIHAQHRHKDSWAAYQEHLGLEREAATRNQAQKQLDATLELAKAAAQATTRPPVTAVEPVAVADDDEEGNSAPAARKGKAT